jgi:lysophospholipase L1-like esterase
MKIMKNSLYIIVAMLLFAGCKPKLNEFSPSAGNANFSKYVALGNSLTAGYSSGALYISGQQNSYAKILADQFSLVGGGAFKIPYMNDENGIGIIDSNGTTLFKTKRVLGYTKDCNNVISLGPVYASNTVDMSSFLTSIAANGPYNNLGVPGAKSFHLLVPQFGKVGTGNPFYTRFATNPGTSTVVGDALAQNPTFFTLWIGNNDVLLYATGGGDQGKDSITDPSLFNNSIAATLTQLTATGAKGAIANIPDITGIPYFTTVPYNGLVLTDQSQVTALNTNYAPLGITFTLGPNPFIIADAAAPGGRRQIKSNEYILLTVPQDSLKCFQLGSAIPIPAKYVLDQTEVAKVNTAITTFNNTISGLANTFNIAFVDANATMKALKTGITYSGLTFTTTYVTGGAFSLDGIHLTPRGNAIIANTFIDAINSKYSASVPHADVTKYSGLKFP